MRHQLWGGKNPVPLPATLLETLDVTIQNGMSGPWTNLLFVDVGIPYVLN